MYSIKNTGRIVGVLFLTLMVTYTLGAVVFIQPVLDDPDYLVIISANKNRIITILTMPFRSICFILQ